MHARFLAPALTALVAAGCQLDGPPELVKVDRLDPARASAGDHITIRGEGFPPGRPATVTFRGELFRPGSEPRSGFQLSLRAAPEGRDSLLVKLDSDTERRFTGAGDAPTHATFRGDVRVVFQPGASGLTEVSGALHDARFDVLPSPGEGLDPVPGKGAQALAFLGMTAAPDPAGGLRISAVDPGGRAALSGIAEGDLLVELDGVTVLSPDDLSVRGGERRARARIERGSETRTVDLDVQGLSPMGPSTWVVPAAAIVSACALLVLPLTPLGPVLRWLGRLLGARARRGDGPPARAGVRSVLEGGGGSALLVAGVLVLSAVGAAFARLSVGRAVLSPDLDLIAGVLGASMTLVISRAVWVGPSFALRSLAFVVPATVAVLGSVVAGSRFVIAEIVSAQGGAPWRWAAMQNPGLMILALVLIASAVPEAAEAEPLPCAPDQHRPASRRSADRVLVRLSEWAYLWVTCGVAVLVFFGGYRLPGVSTSVQESGRFLLSLGAALFFGKLVALVLGVLSLRRIAAGVALRHVALPWAQAALPASIACAILAASWATLLETTSSSALSDLSGLASVLSLLVIAAALALLGRRSPGAPSLAVNPWL